MNPTVDAAAASALLRARHARVISDNDLGALIDATTNDVADYITQATAAARVARTIMQDAAARNVAASLLASLRSPRT